jgi:GR25 family glycosyltransferase involved in LPS biosynthesis
MDIDLPLDKIYYINLDNRTDKRLHIESAVLQYFKNTCLEERVERFSAIRHSEGAIGCSLSHLEIARKAKAVNARYYMVMEDDFEFLVTKEVFLETLQHIFKPYIHPEPIAPLDFKVIMLAYNAINRMPLTLTYSSNLADVLEISTNAQTTAGFIVNGAYYDELINCWEKGVNMFMNTGQHWNFACDQCWKELQKEKWFITKTRIGKQKPGYSDLGNKEWVNPSC